MYMQLKLNSFSNFKMKILNRLGTIRAQNLHHLYVMDSQSDVHFGLLEKKILEIKIFILGCFCPSA